MKGLNQVQVCGEGGKKVCDQSWYSSRTLCQSAKLLSIEIRYRSAGLLHDVPTKLV